MPGEFIVSGSRKNQAVIMEVIGENGHKVHDYVDDEDLDEHQKKNYQQVIERASI